VSEQAVPGRANGEITCLIVDDHEVVREGLRLSLSRAPHIRVVGEAPDGATAVALAERRRPDVVIMDVRMPGMDGLEATKILTQKAPDVAVLIFTAYSERQLLRRGLESGAKGYILKEAPHQTLLRAIDKVVAGEGFVDTALMPAFLSGNEEVMLTARERERPRSLRTEPQSRRRRSPLTSTRCMEPVTVRAAPQNVTIGAATPLAICDTIFRIVTNEASGSVIPVPVPHTLRRSQIQ